MEFLIQHNLMAEDQLLKIKDAIKDYPHRYVGMIPFSHEMTCDTPIEGTDFIPYGSTLMTTVASQGLGWKGLFFDMDTFNYKAALQNRGDMLNDNVMPLDIAIRTLDIAVRQDPKRLYFTRPSHDLKQFSGQVIEAEECRDWFKDMLECATSGSYKLEADTPVVLCPPKNIQAEWRWFVVGGKVVSGSMYRAHGQLRKERVAEQALIDEAQSLADRWLPAPCCVMDLALVGDDVKVVEFNCINSSGFYDNDIPAVFKALYEYCEDM
jgi:hypothetical protein